MRAAMRSVVAEGGLAVFGPFTERTDGSQRAGFIQWAAAGQHLEFTIAKKPLRKSTQVPLWFEVLLNSVLSAEAMAGDDTKGHPAGTKTGDIIHVFQSGSIQMITDVSIDPAGNVWAANNWNSLEAAAFPNPSRPTSTWGGGSGFTVIYGVAAPVKPPRIGKVQRY
jgi:hypothetical protein